jgi:hypothetical protein
MESRFDDHFKNKDAIFCYNNGLVPMNDQELAAEQVMMSSSVSLPLLWQDSDNVEKYIKWDSELEKFMEHLAALIDYAGRDRMEPCTLYTEKGLNYLDGFALSQGNLGSCCGAAHRNSHVQTTLTFAELIGGITPNETSLSITYAAARGNGKIAWGSGLNLCLAPFQKVFTEEGAKEVQELSGKSFICISYSKRLGRMAAKRAIADYTGYKRFTKITTDKGIFYLSEDHYMMLKTGETIQVKDLKLGMSLLPCNTTVRSAKHGKKKQYICVSFGSQGKGKYKDKRTKLHKLIMKDIAKLSPEAIHHANGNSLDNRLENLIPITKSDHHRLHASTEEGIANMRKAQLAYMANEKAMRKVAEFHKNMPKEIKLKHLKAASNHQLINTAYRIINEGYCIDTADDWVESYQKRRRAKGDSHGRASRSLNRIITVFGTYDNFISQVNNGNHRVIGLHDIGYLPAYHVSVDDAEPDDKRKWTEHNFMICPKDCNDYASNGIIVCNSPMAQWSSKIGNYLTSDMGKYSTSGTGVTEANRTKYAPNALANQSIPCFVPDLTFDTFYALAKAGLACNIGSDSWPANSTIDANGMSIGTGTSKGAHATTLGGHAIEIENTRYILWTNSHGPRHKIGTRIKQSPFGTYLTKANWSLLKLNKNYGMPYINFSEMIKRIPR